MPGETSFSFSRESSLTRFEPVAEGNAALALDLLSIRQTKENFSLDNVSENLRADIEFELEQSHAIQSAKCENNAPFIFFVDNTDRARVVQGCCNNWLCERCGQIRARHEYGRMVQGAKDLAEQGHKLYFWTLTCRGREMPLETAMSGYYAWTSKLLDAARQKCKREGGFWAYAAVTERQKRLHPHSHIISTYCPSDAIETVHTTDTGQEITLLASEWFTKQNHRAGLGPQHVIRPVYNPTGVAVYLAKYFFKTSMSTEWPRNWRRVRYSRSWPKLPEQETEIAWPLLKMADWQRMEALGLTVYADSQVTLEAAYARLISCVVWNGEADPVGI